MDNTEFVGFRSAPHGLADRTLAQAGAQIGDVGGDTQCDVGRLMARQALAFAVGNSGSRTLGLAAGTASFAAAKAEWQSELSGLFSSHLIEHSLANQIRNI
ncbi:MAG: hypothetical protein VCC00_09300 [Deltaproteobacteria bacterium]